MWSPSTFSLLSQCPLALAFDRDVSIRTRYRRGSTFTAIGNVAHTLTEQIASHKFDSVPLSELKAALSAAWNEAASKEFEKLCISWAPATPPPPRDWPFQAKTKARTLLRLKADAMRYREWADHGGVGNPALVENEMRDDSISLAGRADRIERHDNRVAVVDLKTGAEVDRITDDNRRQLMLYAHLYRTEHGVTPNLIVVMNASGDRFEEEIDDSGLDQIKKIFVKSTTDFNIAANANKDFTLSATPSEETCRWCTYRVVCPNYWATIQPEWNVTDAAGTVLSKQGDSAFTLELLSPDHRLGEVCQVLAADAVECEEGDVIAITDAFFDGDVLRCRWNSRFSVF